MLRLEAELRLRSELMEIGLNLKTGLRSELRLLLETWL